MNDTLRSNQQIGTVAGDSTNGAGLKLSVGCAFAPETAGINPAARWARTRRSDSRRAFTMVELLIVIALLLILATMALAVYNANGNSDRTRSAARVMQSAMLGAKDRALHAKEIRGVRFNRDLTDPSLVTSFVYLAPIADPKYGKAFPGGSAIQILRPNPATSPDATVVSGTGVDWASLDANGFIPWPTARIRIPATTGEWYVLQAVAGRTSPPYYTQSSGTATLLTLATPFNSPDNPSPNPVAVDVGSSKASCELQLTSELLPFHSPMPLSSGVVIDLNQSSANVQGMWPTTPNPAHIDIQFSPRGMVAGPIAALGSLHFLLNSMQDASQHLNPIDPRNRGDKLIVTLNPQTGLVTTFPIDPTDKVNNTTGLPPGDGLADDLFHFAKLGKAAGQ